MINPRVLRIFTTLLVTFSSFFNATGGVVAIGAQTLRRNVALHAGPSALGTRTTFAVRVGLNYTGPGGEPQRHLRTAAAARYRWL